jgi:hypothetical protein
VEPKTHTTTSKYSIVLTVGGEKRVFCDLSIFISDQRRTLVDEVLSKVQEIWPKVTLAKSSTSSGLSLVWKNKDGRRRKLSSEDALLCFFMYIYHLAPPQLLGFFYKVDMKTMQRSVLTMLVLCNSIFKMEPPSRDDIQFGFEV